MGSIPGLRRSPGERNGSPLQCFCLGNPMDRGSWLALVHGVTSVRHDLASKQNNVEIYIYIAYAQSSLTLCGPMDCSPSGSSVHEILPGKDTGVGCRFLLQGIFRSPESLWQFNTPKKSSERSWLDHQLMRCRMSFMRFYILKTIFKTDTHLLCQWLCSSLVQLITIQASPPSSEAENSHSRTLALLEAKSWASNKWVSGEKPRIL